MTLTHVPNKHISKAVFNFLIKNEGTSKSVRLDPRAFVEKIYIVHQKSFFLSIRIARLDKKLFNVLQDNKPQHLGLSFLLDKNL